MAIRWRMLIGILVVVAIPLAIGFWTGWAKQGQSPLQIESSQLEVGTIRTGRKVKHKIVVRNTSQKTIVVPKVDVSCACTEVSPTRFRLGPSESVSLELKLDPMRLRRLWKRKPLGEFHVGLALFQQGRRVPQQWVLNGKLDPALTLTPASLAYYGTSVCVTNKPGITQYVIGEVTDARYRLDVAEEQKDFHIKCTKDKESPKRWRISVTPKPRSTAGEFDATVWLAVLDSHGKRIGEFPLAIKGLVEDAFVVLPPEIDLFPVDGECLAEQVLIQSNLGEEFRVAAAVSADGAINVRPMVSEWRRTHMATLQFDTAKLGGDSEHQIRIELRDGRSEFLSFHLTVHRVGRALP